MLDQHSATANTNHSNHNRPFASWEVDRDFVLDSFDATKDGGICVRVSVLRIEFPKYSCAVGWKLPNGELKFHIQSYQKFDPGDLGILMANAQEYIQTQVAIVENSKAEKEAARQKWLQEEKVRKDTKKKQYEGNKERRRNENRQRANGGGGGGGKKNK